MSEKSKEGVSEAETPIAKLRNRLTPIFNHFQMRGDLDEALTGMSVEDWGAYQRVMKSNEATCNEMLPQIQILLNEANQSASDLQSENDRLLDVVSIGIDYENELIQLNADLQARCEGLEAKLKEAEKGMSGALAYLKSNRSAPETAIEYYTGILNIINNPIQKGEGK